MNDMSGAGRRLFQSAENLRRSAPDLDSLLNAVFDLIEAEPATSVFGNVERGEDEDGGGKGFWLATAFAFNAIVMKPGRRRLRTRNDRRQIGTVTMVIRLCGSEDVPVPAPDWPWLDQSTLIIGWHLSPDKEDVWEIENFEPSTGGGHISYIGNRIWQWRQPNDGDYHFFVLPLFSLRDEDDVSRHVVAPLRVLFAGGAAESAFPDGSPALVPSQEATAVEGPGSVPADAYKTKAGTSS